MEVTVGLELIAHPVDLPALHLGFKILGQHLQPADQLVAGIDIGDFQRAIAHVNARHQILAGIGADELGALLRQRPELARAVEAHASDQIAEAQGKARHHRAELMAGGAPAELAAFEHRDARAQPRAFERDRQPGEPAADDANVDIEVEGEPRARPQRGHLEPFRRWSGGLAHAVVSSTLLSTF